MRPISDSLYDLLVSQGISARTAGTVDRAGMKRARSAGKSAHSQGLADAAGGTPHRPTAGGEPADLNEGKGTQTEARASFQEVKKRQPMGENTQWYAFRVHTNPNAHTMQARKTAVRSATFLTCIIGGRR